jgi:hypothetical protein
MWRLAQLPDYDSFVKSVLSSKAGNCEFLLVESSGMWGGYLAIESAKSWLREVLLGISGVRETLSEFESDVSGRVRVAVHVRMGDFRMSDRVKPGNFNVSYPLSWYRFVMLEMLRVFNGNCVFYLFTDSHSPELLQYFREFDGCLVFEVRKNDFCDLALASACDIVVCSVSSFSMLASWIGGKPYVWNYNQLQIEDGCCFIWNTYDWVKKWSLDRHIDDVVSPCLPVKEGVPVDDGVVSALVSGAFCKESFCDLLRFGRIRINL